MAEKDYEKSMRERFDKYGKVITPVDVCNAISSAAAYAFANHPSEIREMVKHVVAIAGAGAVEILFPEVKEGGNNGDTL